MKVLIVDDEPDLRWMLRNLFEDEGFEVSGREPDAEARGCSIAADAMLAGTVGQ